MPQRSVLFLWVSKHKAVPPSRASQDGLDIALQYSVIPTNSSGLNVTSRLFSPYDCPDLALTTVIPPCLHC